MGLYAHVGAFRGLAGRKMKNVRNAQIEKFRTEVVCRVLLMDGICSHGLDLR